MVEMPREVVERGCAIDRPLDLHRVGDVSWTDRHGVTELLTRFFFVTRKYTHRLLAFHQFGHQGAP